MRLMGWVDNTEDTAEEKASETENMAIETL